MTLEELKVVISAETQGLTNEIQKVQSQLNNLAKNTAKSTSSIEKSCSKMNTAFKSIFKGIGFAVIIKQLIKLGGQALETASDLEEVQNVVDVSFGEMASEVDAFANSAIQNFGMSALTAKKMASTFMSMANGMGIASKTGKNMSLQLTALAGDMASFYNVQQSVAQTALNSIFTGETESLKKFGIVLTEANLNAFALANGITKSYNAMSQAEKVALRYQYVLQATANAQGDFVRTSGSWANQVRVLKEQFAQLIGILGSGLIKVLTPIVQALNKLLAYLIAIANAIATAFGGKKITGISGSLGGASGSAGDLADNVGDASDNLEESNEQAKKLQKTLASFDELEVLKSNAEEPDSGGGSSGGGGGSAGGGADFEIPDFSGEDLTSDIVPKVEELIAQVNAILEKWKPYIPKLEFNFDTEKALADLESIGLNILNTIAGWGTFIISIGIKVANDLDIGKLIQDALSLVNALTGLASNITDALVPAFLTFYDVALSPFVQKVGEIIDQIIVWTEGEVNNWANWFSENSNNINEFANNLGLIVEPLAQIVANILQVAWDVFSSTLSAIGSAIRDIATSLVSLGVNDLSTIFSILIGIATINVGTNIADMFLKMSQDIDGGLIDKLAYIEGYLTGDGKITAGITSLCNGILSAFTSLKTALSPITTGMFEGFTQSVNALGSSGGALGTLKGVLAGVAGGFKGLWAVISANPIGAIIAAIGLVVAAVVHLWNTNEEFKAFLIDFWENKLKPIFEGIKDAFVNLWEEHLKPLFDEIKPVIDSLWENIKQVWDQIANLIGSIVEFLAPIFESILSTLKSHIENAIEILGGIIDTIKGIIEFIVGVFTGDWEKAWQGIVDIFKGIWDTIVGIAKAPINLVIGIINAMISAIVSGINFCIRAINSISVDIPEWVPGFGGSHIGFNLQQISAPQIPLLANGGVITSPTLAMVGEYPGAKSNPEIVAPQHILQETINASNDNLISAMYQMCMQMISAIESIDMNVSIDDEVIAQSAKRGNAEFQRRTGLPLFA